MTPLRFTVVDGGPELYSAVPTLRFTVAIENRDGPPIRSVMLLAQIRLAVTRRTYDAAEREQLRDIFGAPERWHDTARSLHWTQVALVVPGFSDRTTTPLLVPCTYDFEVAAAKYLHAIRHGDVPLDFLFSGSVFFDDGDGALRTTRISWESEAPYRLPATAWHDTMDRYFPNSAWIRLQRDCFDRLVAYKATHAWSTWEQTLDALLTRAGTES